MSDDLAPTGPVGAVGAPRLRVSDADRAATVARLQAALVEGRLDLDETDERVTTAFAARYHEDLHPLTADLPPHVAAPDGAPTWNALWVSAVWRARIVVLGAEVGGHAPPTSRQRGTAAALAVLALVWMLVCALAGAAMVA